MMNNTLQVNIINKVKNFLGIKEELSATELFSILREYRKQIHPDRYTEEASKKEGEKKFKEVQNLIDELYLYIQNEALHRAPSDLVLFKQAYDFTFTQVALDQAHKEIADLRQSIELNEWEIDQLKKNIEDKETEEFEKEKKQIESLYITSGRSFTSMGIALLLSGLLVVMTNIENVSEKIKKYSPIDEKYLNLSIFIIFIVVLLLTLKRYFENAVMKRRVREVCSIIATVNFMRYLRQKSQETPVKRFSEYEVFEYLYGKRRWWKNLLSIIGFVHFRNETLDQLKDFFLSNLLRKKLISIYYADGLERTFIIK